jgi:hypothetical protein
MTTPASTLDDVLRMFAETAHRFQETDRRFQETDQKFQETDRKIQATDRQIKELGKQIGGLGEKFGSFTEGMAFPSMSKILTERFGMEAVTTRYRVRKNGQNLELDVFAYSNGTTQKAMIVEVKSHLREEHIDRMLTLLSTAKQFLPEHTDKAFYGILAVVDSPAQLKTRAIEQGIYYAEIHDDTFELKVPDSFQARAF